MRFVPNAYREKMDVAKMKAQFTGPSKDQMESLINTIEANIDEPIIERGNDARMSYGDRFNVQFVKEDGAWRPRTPAMAAGLADHVRSLHEWLTYPAKPCSPR